MNNDRLAQLKELFEGKKVIKVEEPNASEAICKFVMEDGSAFRLHATDLGYWVEETIGKENDTYKSLNALISDYFNDNSFNYNTEEAIILTQEDIIEIHSPAGKAYVIYKNKLSDKELKIVNDKSGLKILASAVNLGEWWPSLFTEKYDCPQHLRLF